MYLFSLNQWIVDLFQSAIDFFTHKLVYFFGILLCDITTYKDGVIWTAVSTVYDSLLAIAATLMWVFIGIGLAEVDFKIMETKRGTSFIIFIIGSIIVNAILYEGKVLLLYVYGIGRDIALKLFSALGGNKNILVTGDSRAQLTSKDSLIQIEVPDDFREAVNEAGLWNIVTFILVVIASLVIIFSTISVMLTVYTRLFNIYLMIGLSPFAFCTAFSRPTRSVFFNFVKSFIGICLELTVLVAGIYIFNAFFGSSFNSAFSSSYGAMKSILYYMAEISTLFLMLVSILKGADTLINRFFGL